MGLVKLRCTTDAPPLWALNGRRLPSDIEIIGDGSILVINKVKASHAGTYYCWGYNAIYNENVQSSATLVVQGISNNVSVDMSDRCLQ